MLCLNVMLCYNLCKASSPRQRVNAKDKENFDLSKDNLCSALIDSNEDEDEDDEVFAAMQTISRKPIIKVDRSILKKAKTSNDETNGDGGTPMRGGRTRYLTVVDQTKWKTYLVAASRSARHQNHAYFWSATVSSICFCVSAPNRWRRTTSLLLWTCHSTDAIWLAISQGRIRYRLCLGVIVTWPTFQVSLSW